jgi:hypothetical protein
MLRGERQRLLWLIAPALLTLVLICRTFWYFFSSIGNVPWSDLWPMLSEVRSFRAGQSGWSYLYSAFWGNRPLVPRLFIYVSARFLHYSGWSFVVVTLTAQVAMLLVLLWLFRRAFPERRAVYWLSSIAAVNLLLSSLQMEVFMEGLNIEYTIGYGSAVAAIALSGLPRRPGPKTELRFWIALLLGAVSSGCFAIGLAVFPMMMLAIWLARGRGRYIAITFAVAAVLAVNFSSGYTRPAMGMGMGAFHRPLQALRIVALVLGGPVTLYSRSLGVIAGAAGILIAAAVLFRIARDPALRVTPGAVSLTMIAWFMIASAASIMAGRLSPEWLAQTIYTLPSRYLHPTQVFWAVLFPLSYLYLPRGLPGRVTALAVALTTLILAFGTWNWQWYLPREWAIVNEHLDAAASGFILDVSDPAVLDNVYPVPALRNNVVDYMRKQDLSVFHEPRSHWAGRNVMSIAPADDGSTCRAAIRTVDPLGSGDAFRVTGNLVVDGQTPRRRLDVLFVDSTGIVQGLARTLPIFSERAPVTDFFGYMAGVTPHEIRIFALTSGRMVRCVTAGP